jgi:hypothetical protein
MNLKFYLDENVDISLAQALKTRKLMQLQPRNQAMLVI